MPPPSPSDWIGPAWESDPPTWKDGGLATGGVFNSWSGWAGGIKHDLPAPGDTIEGTFIATSYGTYNDSAQLFYYCAEDGTVLHTIGGPALNVEYPFNFPAVEGGYLMTTVEGYGYWGDSQLLVSSGGEGGEGGEGGCSSELRFTVYTAVDTGTLVFTGATDVPVGLPSEEGQQARLVDDFGFLIELTYEDGQLTGTYEGDWCLEQGSGVHSDWQLQDINGNTVLAEVCTVNITCDSSEEEEEECVNEPMLFTQISPTQWRSAGVSAELPSAFYLRISGSWYSVALISGGYTLSDLDGDLCALMDCETETSAMTLSFTEVPYGTSTEVQDGTICTVAVQREGGEGGEETPCPGIAYFSHALPYCGSSSGPK